MTLPDPQNIQAPAATRQCFWLYTVLNKILAFTFPLLPWEIWLWAPEISLLGIPYAGW